MRYGYPVIPETITVHLGKPNEQAENLIVPFVDYIKNVASSEIYPTWPENAIHANIYAQISYALNRKYTEYYRSQKYAFDITNSTQHDQAYVKNREIFENISKIVDQIFNSYVYKKGTITPLFSQYCNGTTSKCPGLSQWGTVDLAKQGYVPYDILQYYYGPNINIITDVPIEDVPESYPGQPLRLGTSGNSVKTVQSQLNRIQKNYPAIPKIPDENGEYDLSTMNAVKEFQKIFFLTPDGIVGSDTWYKIRFVYNGIKKLNELYSESLSFEEIKPVFPTEIALGSVGEEVKYVQYYLAILGYFYEDMPTIKVDGIYGPDTEAAVSAFQKIYGLPQTKIVDRATWNKLINVYTSLVSSLSPEFYQNKAKIYPGYAVQKGIQNSDVADLQKYLSAISNYYSWDINVPITGNFGNETYQAVIKFQQSFGPRITGIVGPLTWNAIAEQYNKIISKE